MQRIQVKEGSEDTTTLSKILSPLSQDDEATVQVGKTTIDDTSQTLSSLGLQHGSLITITLPRRASKTAQASRFKIEKSNRFDPFPDLARDYQMAIRRKAQRGTTGKMSYGDLAHVQSALHVVEPQAEGPLKRVYMCRVSAERFQSNCIVTKHNKPLVVSRVALLFGTIQRERVDLKPVKARTSLSSTTSDQDYCQVAKVQALWEPPQVASTKHYDATSLTDDAALQRALTVADWLGLTLVGWIFSYTDSRSEEEDSLPVWASDVHTGACQTIEKMKRLDDRQEGAKFVTLAMDANTGATEAFQLSDVSIQMVAEKMWDGSEQERFVTTQHEIIVDGKETTQLDSVLCLVNTGMLSQVGSYAGKTTNSVNRTSGTLTTKTKKALLAALDKDSSDHCSLLNALSDFNILVALDALLPAEQTKDLCRLVRKWVRGQKRGTKVPKTLKLSLQSVLNS